MQHTIDSSDRTVWVNGEDGSCIGRFSAKGVDVHKTATEQMKGGTQCLDCCHGMAFDESWEYFKQSMLKHYDITIPDSFKPKVRS